MAEIGIKIVGEDGASSAFRSVSDSARATAQEVSSLGDTWSNMSNTIAGGVVKAQAIIGLFQGAMSAAGNATQGIRAFLQSTVDMNAELEGSRNSFSVLLGGVDKANALLGEMRAAAQTTALSFEEFRNAAKYLLGFQFNAKDVVQITKDIGAAVYALGAKDQGGMDRIIRALGQMKAQGRVSREELNQLSEVGVPALKMLADAFGVTTSEMSNMVRKGTVPVEQAISGLIGQFRALYGASGAQMSQNFAVLTSNLGDFIDQAKLAVGQGLFQQFRRDLEGLSSIVASPVFLRLASLIGDKLGGAFRQLNDTAILPTMSALKQFMNALDITNPNPAILGLAGQLNDIFGQLIGKYFGPTGLSAVRNFTAVLGQLGVAAATILRGGSIYDVFNQLSSIGSDTTAGKFIISLTQEFANLQTALPQLQSYVRPVIASITAEFGKLSQSDTIKWLLKSFDDLFSVTDGKGRTFKLRLGEIVAFISVSVQNISTSLQKFGTLFSDALDSGKVQPLVQAISGVLSNITSRIDTWGAQTLDGIVAWLAKILNPNIDGSKLEGKVGDTIGNIKLIIGGLSDAFSNALGEGLFPKLAPRITAIGQYIMSQLGIVAQGLGTYLADRLPIAFEMGFNAIGAAWSNWNDRWKLQLFNDISASIGDPIDKVLNSIGLEGKVTAALQGIWQSKGFMNLSDRVSNTNQKLKEQQSILQAQMSNLPKIGEYFSGLGDVASLQGAFQSIQSNASGPAITAGKSIVNNVSRGASSQMPAVANSIGETASSSLTGLANSLSNSSAISATWQNVGYSMATAVSRGFNSGFQELVGNIQMKLGIPQIMAKVNESVATVTQMSAAISSHITSKQLHPTLTTTANGGPPPGYGGGNRPPVAGGTGNGLLGTSGTASDGSRNYGGTTTYTSTYNVTVNANNDPKGVESAVQYMWLRNKIGMGR